MSPAIPGGGPPSPGPRLPWNSMARSSDAMRDTVIRCPSRNAPLPRAACQRAPKAGALATPATTSPPASIASRVANTGMPRTKLRVPSMGSMMSRASVDPGASPSSSPSTPSSGWFWRTAARAIASIAWSASVTGLRSGFSWTRSPAVRNHRSASSSARSASSVRKRSQSAGDMESEREWSGWDSNPRPLVAKQTDGPPRYQRTWQRRLSTRGVTTWRNVTRITRGRNIFAPAVSSEGSHSTGADMKRTQQCLLVAGALSLAGCAGSYTSAAVVYSEPAEYVYVVPVDRVVVVTREVLVDRGWVVYRVERSGPNRIVWARRSDDEIVRIFATPQGQQVAVRGLWEVRERHDRGKHKGWEKRGAPRDIITDIDVRLKSR